MKASVEHLLEHVRRRAQNYFPEIKDIGEIRITRTCHRAYSDIHFVTIGNSHGPARQLLIKVFPGVASQFHAMTRVWHHFATHSSWKIPQPLDYLEEDQALIMGAVTGVPLQDSMPWVFWGGQSLRGPKNDCNRVGQWLRFYHDLDRTEDFACLDVAAGVEETLGELSAAQFDRDLYRLMASYLRTLATQIANKPRPLSRLHGDFTVDNIILDREYVTALDLCANARNIVDYDIASFLNSLLLLRLTRPAPRSGLRQIQNSFLRGYYGREPGNEPVAIFLQCMGLVNVALEILGRRRSVFLRAWLQRFIAGALPILMENASLANGHF